MGTNDMTGENNTYMERITFNKFYVEVFLNTQ